MDGSPKKYATDVAAGLHSINRSTLKRFTPQEVKKLEGGLQIVLKELRNLVVDSGDFQALKDKGMKTQRVMGALQVIATYFREQKKWGN